MPFIHSDTAAKSRSFALASSVSAAIHDLTNRTTRWRQPLTYLAFLVFGTLISLLRQSGHGAFDTLWAEDGAIFLQAALNDPMPSVWLEGYAGYMHLAPRMIASVAAIVPLSYAAAFMAVVAAFVTATLAAIIFEAAREHIPSSRLRFALALSLIALPAAGLETTNSPANIHWYLLSASTWVVLWKAHEWPKAIIGSGLLFVTATSDPFIVVVIPIIAARLVKTPTRAVKLFAAALSLGLLCQMWVMWENVGSRSLDPLGRSILDLTQMYGFHILDGAAFGIVLREILQLNLGVGLSGALAIFLLGVFLVPAAVAARTKPSVPLALVIAHVGLYFAPTVLAAGNAPRYTVAPIFLLYSLAFWGFAHAPMPFARRAHLCFLALFGAVLALDFAPENRRAAGPSWSAELAQAREICRSEPSSGPIEILIAPYPRQGQNDRTWSVAVSCNKLLQTSPQ